MTWLFIAKIAYIILVGLACGVIGYIWGQSIERFKWHKALEEYMASALATMYKNLLAQMQPFSPKARETEDLLAKVREVSSRQVALIQQLSMPNKSAAHARWKNDLVKQVEELDAEKIGYLRQVLANGHNPKMLVYSANDGQTEEKLLSDLMIEYDTMMAKKNQPISKSPPKLEIVKEVPKPILTVLRNDTTKEPKL